ncbi:MAG: YifB family Mg chelatase-like AAA ATPase [Firmicutes bacterium]|nr:YifB family Mg chelatase-like AAA ATPase [Bacillota bacterium]
MYSRVLTAGLYGLDCEATWVEVDTSNGLPRFAIVGLANQSVREASERIHSAVVNCGFEFPPKRVAVNLTPANLKKDGSHYDLAIALGLLLSTGQIEDMERITEYTAFFGELTLDGKIGRVEGILPMAISLQKEGIKQLVIPASNLEEARLVKGMNLFPVSSLKEVTDILEKMSAAVPVIADGKPRVDMARSVPDFSDIRGQESIKRAAQVAAAGMHAMLMIGPPGVGKSMIGKRIGGILPPMSYEEQLEATKIYSIAGELKDSLPMIVERPFRAPHHGISASSLIGGGTKPRPGEISLAHCGVLFLDELPEFAPGTLDTLRQPLEDGTVSVMRVNGKCVFPSRFMLVAAMNPCRCGYYGDPVRPCSCSESDRKRYVGRVSGPLLDRIDINVVLERIPYEDLSNSSAKTEISSADLRKGVENAFGMQKERYKNLKTDYNSQLTPLQIRKYCALDGNCEALMREAFRTWSLSARVYHRILRVARTIADTDCAENIREEHILEALSYRLPEKYFE